MTDNTKPLSSGQHYSDTNGANWNYTKSITSGAYFEELSAGQWFTECQSGLMVSLSSIASQMVRNDGLIAVCAEPSAVYWKMEDIPTLKKKAGGLNWEWLLKEHGSSSASMSYTNKLIRFNPSFAEIPMLNDIRFVQVSFDITGRFSADTGYYDYSDFSRREWHKIYTNAGGIDAGYIYIRAIMKNWQIISGCVYVDMVFPEVARGMIDAPSYCWPGTNNLQVTYFNGETAKTMDIFGLDHPEPEDTE